MDSIKPLRTMETGFRRTHMADRYCLSAFSFYGGKIPISVVLICDETNRLQKQSEPNRAVFAILFLIYSEQVLVAFLRRNPMKMFWSKRRKHLCKEKELFFNCEQGKHEVEFRLRAGVDVCGTKRKRKSRSPQVGAFGLFRAENVNKTDEPY